jgi:glutathione S-transferase
MVQLIDTDIQTREVLNWEGVHLLHYATSSCSQKTRIVLNMKHIRWESHIVNVSKKENNDEWFLGVNPRGLVPVLIHDGEVHIESNDILMYLDKQYTEPKLVPKGREDEMLCLLQHEDDLHLDLRNLTMRYVIPPDVVGKSPEVLASYRRYGSGTVQGKSDSRRPLELDYWECFNSNGGVSDDAVTASAHRFYEELGSLEKTLLKQKFLFGDVVSLLDVAWFVYVTRMKLVSYPVEKLHPRLDAWYKDLKKYAEFNDETIVPEHLKVQLADRRARDISNGKSLVQLAGFHA